MTLTSIDPATGNVLCRYDEISIDQAALKVETAQQAFGQGRRAPLARCSKLFTRLADTLRSQQADLARLMANANSPSTASGRL